MTSVRTVALAGSRADRAPIVRSPAEEYRMPSPSVPPQDTAVPPVASSQGVAWATVDGLTAVVGTGRGSQLRSDTGAPAIWIPLRGGVQVGPGIDGVLHGGEFQITESDSLVRCIARGPALWVALFGTPAAWHRHMPMSRLSPVLQGPLIPDRRPADRALRRSAVALARALARGEGLGIAIENLAERIAALQEGHADAIARCPGRTYAQRRQVFVRLQRVRNHMSANCEREVENAQLAQMANYSLSHFVRTFHAVYLEAPHAFLVRARLERAKRLLRNSPLAINEIAIESGFESASAFSRLFRKRFGVTATNARRRHVGLELLAG